METLPFTKVAAQSVYKKADQKTKEVLEELFGKQTIVTSIFERVQSFEDACFELGENPEAQYFNSGTPDEIAYKKLKVICLAINEGTVLSFANSNQKKWRPWFKYEGSGFRFYGSSYDDSGTNAYGGSRLMLETEEKSDYVGKKFIQLWNQLLN